MYLKEIEINGFKSFADKINLSLDNNITCIVGPNGSGKSNIVDAVRWVLGEQSIKSLRGENSTSDIIFQGSKSRKEENMASVTLTFDNIDHYIDSPYNTIAVKRRAYRTGENEYFLNGEKCRLKDITELFLDTGISKSSFNIISQGDISRILSSTSMERRIVLEEAAGIMKYKTRREEALKKLGKTEDNMERLNDIIGELENRIEPLKEQSEAALDYLETKKNLEKVEVSLITEEITLINQEYQKKKDYLNLLNEEILTLNLQNNTDELDELKKKEKEENDKLVSLQNNLLVLTKEEENLNSERLLIKERSKYDAEDLKVHENIMLLKEKRLKLENEISIIESEINTLKENVFKEEENLKKEKNKFNDLNNQKKYLEKELFTKTKENQELSNRVNLLKNNLAGNDTMSLSVKRILNNPRLTGIMDAFGNILETDNKYSKALEVCTLSTKNFLISKDDLVVKEAIDYLKNNNLGRATFFPINVIKPKGIDYETLDLLERELSYLGVLSDFVKYDEKYRNIVLNQLGNIIVCKDLDDATHLSKLVCNRYKIVTLTGEVIHIGGSVTGGSLNKDLSPISLRNELNDLLLKKNSLELVIEELNHNLEKINENFDISQEKYYEEKSHFVTLEENYHHKENLKCEKQEELTITLQELANLNDLNGNLLMEEEEITKKYYDKQKEKELLLQEYNSLIIENNKLKDEIEKKEGLVKINNSNLHQKEKELKDLEIIINKMDLELDNNLNILNSEYSLTYERAREDYLLDSSIEDAKREVINYKKHIKELGMVNLLAIDEYKEVSERYNYLVSQKSDLMTAKEMLNGIILDMDEVMKEDFSKTYIELNEEFKKVFSELFKGGDAKLVLTDPDNLLETGVDIIACPPGKTLKAISLLSGGEKTLTAISLLFAILNIRKIPFCLFDEVEAALDESNVDTFGHYLKHYEEKTQFLLITHKKRTMEYAKTLYGITMQESGVSKLVSVKLENI